MGDLRKPQHPQPQHIQPQHLQPQKHEVPHAEPTPVSKAYWDLCAQGQLAFQRCADCGFINAPATEVCRDCLGTRLSWEASTGRGTLYSWTVVWRPVTPTFEVPYAPAIVEMDEGFHVVTNLIGVEPDRIEAGMPVQAEFHEVGDGLVLPYFRPYIAPAGR
ncbi:Zn-ribbon domain-containing OB-fold protein [Actinomadura sp. 9N407]|uniref:Zn-ribbon domain-containing OB-fold protein n=1 Tax=Actinomadura sp. 9N407 TaxID=3375154 RepID=UPI0037AEE071